MSCTSSSNSEQPPDKSSQFVVEYQKAQDSAQHHDTLAWSSFGVCIAANLALMGFVFKDLQQLDEHRIIFSLVCVLGITFTLATWIILFMFNNIKRHKYARCKELELILGFQQHLSLQYSGCTQRILVSIIFFILFLLWLFLLFYVNCFCP